jgi:RHS repeat-associated protein
VSAAVFEVPERPSDRSRPDYRHHPGYHLSRHPRSYCRARKGLAQPKTRVRAIAYPCSAWVELLRLVAPAQRPQNSTRYVPVAVAFTFGFEGKHGIGTDTDAGGIVLMGARLYNPDTGRFLQVDPVFGGSANAYDYVDQDPVNASDLAGTLGGTRQGECAGGGGRWEGNGPNSGRCIPGPAPHSLVGEVVHWVDKNVTPKNVGVV